MRTTIPRAIDGCSVVSPASLALQVATISDANGSLLWFFIHLLLQIPLPDVDPDGYKKALARTRQAQDVARAVTFMHNGEPAR